jgi:hypothetical protein
VDVVVGVDVDLDPSQALQAASPTSLAPDVQRALPGPKWEVSVAGGVRDHVHDDVHVHVVDCERLSPSLI